MGTRGPRSAEDLAAPMPHGELIPIDIKAMVRLYHDRREVERSLKRAERQGQAVFLDGKWYATGTP